MDQDLVRLFEKCDAHDRATAVWEAKQALQTRSADASLIFKRCDDARVLPQPQPQNVTAMDAELQQKWNRWADSRIKRMIRGPPNKPLPRYSCASGRKCVSSRRLRDLLDQLTPDERLACLMCVTMDRERGALRPLVGIVNVLGVLAGYLSQRDAIALAETMRDGADFVEYRRERIPIG